MMMGMRTDATGQNNHLNSKFIAPNRKCLLHLTFNPLIPTLKFRIPSRQLLISAIILSTSPPYLEAAATAVSAM